MGIVVRGGVMIPITLSRGADYWCAKCRKPVDHITVEVIEPSRKLQFWFHCHGEVAKGPLIWSGLAGWAFAEGQEPDWQTRRE